MKSFTSIGTNIEEANGAQSRRGFIAKLQISYKETRETLYWLRLLKDSGLCDTEEIEKLRMLAQEILYLLIRILKTAKKNL